MQGTTLEDTQTEAPQQGAGNRYYTGPASDHFDGTRFFNRQPDPPQNFGRLLRWRFGGHRAVWPKAVDSPFQPARPEPRVDSGSLRVTMVGHATLLVQTCGINILTDPVWSARASPLSVIGPKRVNRPGIRFADLPPIDLVLVSHNHYDHMDLKTLKRLHAAHAPLVVTPLGNEALLHAADPTMHVTTLDWGQSVPVGEDMRLHATPAHHWSARGIRDRRMALWAAFVLQTPHGNVYHVGDTGFADGANYAAAATAFGGFRLAILPIGAYEPRWFMKHHHQTPDEAVRGMKLAKAAHAVGHHWGTFQLTDEPVDEPPRKLAEATAAHTLQPDRFRALLPGESWDVPQVIESAGETGNPD